MEYNLRNLKQESPSDDTDIISNQDVDDSNFEKLPYIVRLYYHDYEVYQNDVSAACNHCPNDKRKRIKGKLNISSNFISHLKKHEEQYNEYVTAKKTTSRKRRSEAVDSTNELSTSKRICESEVATVNAAQAKANDLVTDFIVKLGLPINTLNHEAMRNLVSGLSKIPFEVDCPSSHDLKDAVLSKFEEMNEEIMSIIKCNQYHGTTADIWSSRGRSFLGVTLHCISQSFERISVAIAIRRIDGSQTAINVGLTLQKIFDYFGLVRQNHPVTVTNNGSSFDGLFKDLCLEIEINNEEDRPGELEVFELSRDPLNIDEKPSEDHEEEHKWQELKRTLPPRLSCCSHTLSLICTADLTKAAMTSSFPSNKANPKERDNVFSMNYERSFDVCTCLLKLLSKSNEASENFTRICGKSIRRPEVTRWNSLYESIVDLLEVDLKLLNDFLANEGTMKEFDYSHFIFLKEYVKLVQPISTTLDRLQGEKLVILGDIIPNVLYLKAQLQKLSEEDFKYCNGVPEFLIDCLQKRFPFVFFDSPYKIDPNLLFSTVSVPKYKLNWLHDKDLKDYIKNLTVHELRKISEGDDEGHIKKFESDSNNALEEDEVASFFLNRSTQNSACNENKYELEYNEFLEINDHSYEVLNLERFKNIRKMFFKYNAGTPSSAPVEKLFSQAGIVLGPKRTCLGDDLFECLTLLKANKKL